MARRALLLGVCIAILLPSLHAQTDTPKLPIRRVVLYKNGVGYFEHLGRVRGNQSLAIDFNSAQLNDVLQSLTTLDLGGGRIGNVSFNSDAPLAQRLGALPLPIGENTTFIELLGHLRGARIELRAGPRAIAGRLLSVEQRPGAKDEPPLDVVTLVTDASRIESMALSPSVSVRLVDRELAQEIANYLTALASNRSADRRRMTIAAVGAGERDVLVSYISEVPVWKTTYRIVLPSLSDVKPQLQGWAIVDNTIGEDWDGVELSLMAGAPQSFIQPLSQPLYVSRPVVEIARGLTTTPQTHQPTLVADRAESLDAGVRSGISGGVAGGLLGGVGGGVGPGYNGGDAVRRSQDSLTIKSAPMSAPSPPPAYREKVEQVLANEQSAAEGESVGDLFEYRVSTPITVRKNESALVPIVVAAVDVERVSLWNERSGSRPLRSLWLTNTSALTLDAGSFTVLDAATFAGEGLVDVLKPGERRLLSYAVDLGLQVESRNGDESRRISHIRIDRGDLFERTEQRTRKVYTVRNNDATPRTVVIEHPIRPGWTLAGDAKPIESASTVHRFSVAVPPHTTTTLTVEERRPIDARTSVSTATDEQLAVIVRDARTDPALERALAPIRAQKAEVARLVSIGGARSADVALIGKDQERLRENIRSLKGSAEERELLKRYVSQLNAQEDRLAALTRERDEVNARIVQARAELERLIEALSIDLDVADRPLKSVGPGGA
jgi:hypothetical protein